MCAMSASVDLSCYCSGLFYDDATQMIWQFYFYFIILFIYLFWDSISLCRPSWIAVEQPWLIATPNSKVQAILLPQPPELLGLQACSTTCS